MGIDVIGKSNDAFTYINDYDIFVAIGNNEIRGKIQSQLEMEGANIPALIHPSAIIGDKGLSQKTVWGVMMAAGIGRNRVFGGTIKSR